MRSGMPRRKILPGKTCQGAASEARTRRERRLRADWHGRCIAWRAMETTAYIAWSRQVALQRHLDVVANNVRT